MKHFFPVSMILLIFAHTISCKSDGKEYPPEKAIFLLEKYIVGNFNNLRQIQEDISKGQQLHPSARLVNIKIDDWILNAPQREGFWLLEEGHFENPGMKTEVKPYIFFYEAVGDTAVKMHVYTFPVSMPSETIRHTREDLRVEYKDLNASINFKPMQLEYKQEGFHYENVFNLPGGMIFTFKKSIRKDGIDLLELWHKDAKRLTTYDTPLILRKEL